jgi:hypothetical protein
MADQVTAETGGQVEVVEGTVTENQNSTARIASFPKFPGMKHYIRIDEDRNIIEGWSKGIYPQREVTDDDIFLHEGMTQFRLFPGGTENPSLRNDIGLPKYKYVNGEVVDRPQAELDEGRAAYDLQQKIYQVRSMRDRLLADTDKYVNIPDFPISEDNRNEFIAYRAKLRDLTDLPDFPDIEWPEAPTYVNPNKAAN